MDELAKQRLMALIDTGASWLQALVLVRSEAGVPAPDLAEVAVKLGCPSDIAQRFSMDAAFGLHGAMAGR